VDYGELPALPDAEDTEDAAQVIEQAIEQATVQAMDYARRELDRAAAAGLLGNRTTLEALALRLSNDSVEHFLQTVYSLLPAGVLYEVDDATLMTLFYPQVSFGQRFALMLEMWWTTQAIEYRSKG
jgi:hypothetical protein